MTPYKPVINMITGILLTGMVTTPAEGAGQSKLRPLTDADFHDHGTPDPNKVSLGQLLMFDKILSGNRNISCATCHHPYTGTGNGLSLPIGEGGLGLGVPRDTGSAGDEVIERVPRNAPHVWNKGAREFTVMFHDGRLAVDTSQPSGFMSPASGDLPENLENLLAAQAMFPVTSATEMAGQAGENPVADAAAEGNLTEIWRLLAIRLQRNDEYVDLFTAAFDDINAAEDITFAHAANAISAFERVFWRADDSPFDRYLRGDNNAMSNRAQKGMDLFYKSRGGGVSYGDCHSGVLQTDHSFHAIGMPQIGPGRGDAPEGRDNHDDFGREQVTGGSADRYKFRTPSLRNVALNAPYGHSGAYNTLRAVVEHHIDSVTAINNYDQRQARLPSRYDLDEKDFVVMDDDTWIAEIAAHSELQQPLRYSNTEIDLIIDFLHALTDRRSLDNRHHVPERVPSGLGLAD